MHQVGKNIDSWCSKCSKILAHTIEAIVGTVIKKVHCNTCKAAHMYRPQAPQTKVKGAKTARDPKAAPKTRAPKWAGEYSKLMANQDEKKARAYSFKGIYDQGELINHTQFGLGYVTAQKDSSKIEVLFVEGPRLLVQGR